MNISERTQQLNEVLSFNQICKLPGSNLIIQPFAFRQTLKSREIDDFQSKLPLPDFEAINDNRIPENKHFNYFIFAPKGKEKHDKAILLLHGLNERSWKKYLVWAEQLCNSTGKPVILFPIAFHMNRTPEQWVNPRTTFPLANMRKERIANIENATFVNIALSSRLSQEPRRLYFSGRETVYNIYQLMKEIKEGKHPLFNENTSLNVFGYSIGGLISQVLLLANPDKLFSDSRLFLFCGGSIFRDINGNARDIMDSEANDKLHQFYCYDFIREDANLENAPRDTIKKAFKAMIRPDVLQTYRETFFQKASERIRAIPLKKDSVVPTAGLISAFGKSASTIVQEMDFNYSYSHQWPFPLNQKEDSEEINRSFEYVFNKAAEHLVRN
jgi:hypothetical protein